MESIYYLKDFFTKFFFFLPNNYFSLKLKYKVVCLLGGKKIK